MLAITIVIPVYNSEATLERLCGTLVESLGAAYRLQLVLVNDGSRDGSCAACQRLREQYPDVVDYVSLTRNFGEHNAVMAGLHYADGDYTVIMDDDFQNPPLEVHKLVAKIREGYDVVYTRYETKMHSAFRNFGSRLHNWMATRALGKPADLYLSSFKILSRFMVQQIIRYTGPDPYMDAIILRISRNLGVVTVRHEQRKDGKSGYSLGKLVSLWGNMFVSFSLYPLRLVALLGVLMSLMGFFYGSYTFAAWLLPWIQEPDDYQKLDASNWFFRGLMLLAIGIVGEYVGRNYMHVNSDPQFIVRDVQARRPENPAVRRGRPEPLSRSAEAVGASHE
jgi:undecaprenyl-phosphate 4-deoxy-4-formamido-L-arabinose transferase